MIVCNRSQQQLDITLSERNYNERSFFNQAPWDDIQNDRKGIKSLKKRLNRLAVEASRQKFDEVGLEIIDRLNNARMKLKTLGSPRDTVETQRLFLLQLSSEYQSLINKATDGYYGRDDCFRNNASLRLATVIMQENEHFSKIVAKKGSHRAFSAVDQDFESASELDDIPVPSLEDDDFDPPHDPVAESGKAVDEPQEFLELRVLHKSQKKEPIRSEEPIDAWITRRYHDFRGFEVGSSNPSLITALVYDQTSSWAYHALAHVTKVIERIHRCIHDLLKHLCPDRSVHSRLWTFLWPRLFRTYTAAIEHTNFLVEVERNGYPITLNHYFAQTMNRRRRVRIEDRLKKMKAWHTEDDDRQPLLRLEDILNSYASNAEHRIEELGDVLQSYHKVARKRFVDNVCKQVVDHKLICSRQGPLHIFSAEIVGMLKEDDLRSLAGEDEQICEQRKALQDEIDTLEAGCKVLSH